jgi:phage tail P2-like protein
MSAAAVGLPLNLPLDLLPGSASAFERDLAAAGAALDALDPAVIETLWDPWACPEPLLPWLASALSVDLWDDAWNSVAKRQAIADSPALHRLKGTREGLRRALALLSDRQAIVEWFETLPPARRGTAQIVIALKPELDVTRTSAAARRIVAFAKPKSRAVAIGIGLVCDAALPVAASHGALCVITLAPFPRSVPETAVPVAAAIGHYGMARARIEPRTGAQP